LVTVLIIRCCNSTTGIAKCSSILHAGNLLVYLHKILQFEHWYDQSKHRNRVSYGLSSFPSIENWIPKDRLISNDEKILLCGPTLEVKSIKQIQVCTPITRRWVTYVSAKYEQSLKVSSCYVALKKYSSSRTPQFGKIENLFLHSFADKTTVICELVLPPTMKKQQCGMYHQHQSQKNFCTY